ncbi:RloB family protein [Methylobacterium sp. E-045]|uniref:RloB family protein n=1 Tax=Methylobacterium sp. E-045 TaxID=2836575 RepID=UPI001FBB85A7|nr:RloB family protein [Methylobacterium sp. E-045]MCJ2131575.1 RloB family protein [Methylobacterium sp. E-045]
MMKSKRSMAERSKRFVQRDLERRALKVRNPRKVTAVAYDGRRTEAEYFRGWQRKLGTIGMVLAPFYVRSGGNALKAVEACLVQSKSDGPFDEIWCVCDVDDTKSGDVQKAKALASRESINLCLSSRCFEVWLALHWCRISLASLQTEQEAINLVSQHHSAYSGKSKEVPFEVLFGKTRDACLHADWLAQQGLANPATDVHRLIRKFYNLIAQKK